MEGTRVAWSEETGSKLQSAPGFSAYAQDENIWVLLDSAKELGAIHGLSVLQWWRYLQ